MCLVTVYIYMVKIYKNTNNCNIYHYKQLCQKDKYKICMDIIDVSYYYDALNKMPV